MADIVQSLFGISPEMYQQSQQARADQQALQYAQLTPFQQANYAIGRGANMLGNAVGRGLGGEDPELARITARQQISRQINYNDPASIAKGVEMLAAANDTQGAMMLADVGRKAQSEIALAQQRLEEKKTPQERNAAAYARSVAQPNTPQYNQIYQTTLQSLISQEKPDLTTPAQKNARDFALRAGPEGSPAYTDAYFAKLEEFTSKGEKPESKPEIQRLQEYAATLPAGSPLLAQVQAVIKAKSEPSGPKITNVMPGQEKFADIPKFRADVQKTIAPQIQSVDAADQALQAINDSIASNNFVSFNAARVQLAKALGDSQLSRRDVEQAGGDPSLFGGFLDSTSKLFTGTPTLETQNLIKNTLNAIKKVSTDKANKEINVQRNIAYSTPGYDRARVDAALSFPQFAAQPVGDAGGKKAVTRTLKSGKVVTVIEE